MRVASADLCGGLKLLPIAAADPDDIAAALNDFDIARWLSRVPYPYTRAHAAEFLEIVAENGDATRVMVDEEGLAGVVGLDPELGYWVARRAWGRGYASFAARVMLAEHFLAADAAPVVSGHFVGNVPSARVLEKLGFRYTQDEVVRPRALDHDVVLRRMVLTRSDWWAGLGMPILTPRLSLRPIAPDDAEALCRVVTRPEVARMLFLFTPNWTIAECREFVIDWAYTGRLRFRLAIADREGRFLGSIGVGLGAEPPIYYFLDPAFAGQGLASEAIAAFTRFVFERFDLAALTAEAFTDNPASAKVLEKSGFEVAGQGMGSSAARLEPAPIVLYRLTRATVLSA